MVNKANGRSKSSYENDIWNDSVIEPDEFENVNKEFLHDVDIDDDNDDTVTSSSGENNHHNNNDNNNNNRSITNHDTNIAPLTVALLAAGTTGGTTYAFGLYASALKQALTLHQSELDTISATFFCAGLASWLPGMAVDRFGPKLSMMAGGVFGSLSLLAYWSVAMQVLSVSRDLVVVTLSILGIFTFMSSAMVTGSVFKLIVGCCGRGSKGTAVGVAKGYVGLGSGAYTCMFEYLQRNHSDWSDLDFLPLAAFFAFAVVSLPALFLLNGPPQSYYNLARKDVTTPHHFKLIYGGLCLLGAVVVGASIRELFHSPSPSPSVLATATQVIDVEEEYYVTETSTSKNYFMAFFVAAAWFLPILCLLCLPIDDDSYEQITCNGNEEIELIQHNHTTSTKTNGDHLQLPQYDYDDDIIDDDDDNDDRFEYTDEDDYIVDTIEMEEVKLTLRKSNNIQSKDLTLMQMLSTLSAWLLLWTCTVLAGGGTLMTNHVGQMAESLDFPPLTAPSCLALFSAAQAASRVVTGAMSEALLNSEWNIPRPIFLVLASIWCFVAHLLMGLATSEIWFVIAVIISGAAFGMIWPLMVLIVGECYGTAHVGANYMFYDGVTSAIGTLLLSKFVAQQVYENHITSSGLGTESELICYGEECFQTTHHIIAGLSLTCVVTSILLVRQTRHIYTK